MLLITKDYPIFKISTILYITTILVLGGLFINERVSNSQQLATIHSQFQTRLSELNYRFSEMEAEYQADEPIIKIITQADLKPATDMAIRAASMKHNVDYTYLKTLSIIESGADPKAVSFTGAKGLYQFTSMTASLYDLETDLHLFNPYLNADAAARLTKDNRESLKRVNLEPTHTNLYLAHQQGVRGLLRIYSVANGERSMSRRLRRRLNQNGGRRLSAEQFIMFWDTRISRIYNRLSKEDSSVS